MSVKQAAGFALAEVVIAAAIFAIGAMLVTGFYLTASGRAVLGRNVTAGALLAQQQIEVAQSKAYSNLSTLQATETLDSTANLTQVQVTVSWSESTGQKSVTVYTLRVSP